MAACASCGHGLSGEDRFCPGCGAATGDDPPPAARRLISLAKPPPPPPPPSGLGSGTGGRGSAGGKVGLAVAGVALIAGLAVIAAVLHLRTGSDGVDETSAAKHQRASSTPTVSAPVGSVPSSKPVTKRSASIPTDRIPATSAQALRLDRRQATLALDELVRRDRPTVATLAGSWVPQVSSKCAGLTVDLQPDFRADGVPDTPHVTPAQILALHTALASRYRAVTTTLDVLGGRTTGRCAGEAVWMSLVPQRFATAGGANAWCDRQRIPVDECLARKVVPLGEHGTDQQPRD